MTLTNGKRTLVLWTLAVLVVPLLVGIFAWAREVAITLTEHGKEIEHLQDARAEIEKMRSDIAELKANARK